MNKDLRISDRIYMAQVICQSLAQFDDSKVEKILCNLADDLGFSRGNVLTYFKSWKENSKAIE